MNINEISQLIAAADVCGHVPLITGLHGVGKSESAAQYANNNNMHYEPLILSLMDTGDMLGLPVTQEVSGMTSTTWAAPTWYTNIVNAAWPSELSIDKLQFHDTDFRDYFLQYAKTKENTYVSRKDLNDMYCEYYGEPEGVLHLLRQDKVDYLNSKRSVLFLDEFNRAPQDILNASLQLILDHRMHNHVLPRVRGQETLVVAAINPADGDYTVQEFDPALLDRFVTAEADPDFESWLSWAKKNNVNQLVIDFLIDNQQRFHFTPKDGTKGTSPRTWTRLGTYMDKLESTPKEIMSHYLKGTLGSSVAAQFLMFYKNYGSNISIKDIEKAAWKEIKNAAKRKGPINVEESAKVLEQMMEKVESIRKMEFAEILIKKYVEEEPEQALPMLLYMYSLPTENLVAVLKKLQVDDPESYGLLARIDKEINGKQLFLKLVSNLKGFS